MIRSKDESSRAVANLKNWRCTVHRDPNGIAQHINTGQPVVAAKKVTVTVSVEADFVVEAEGSTSWRRSGVEGRRAASRMAESIILMSENGIHEMPAATALGRTSSSRTSQSRDNCAFHSAGGKTSETPAMSTRQSSSHARTASGSC